MDEDPFGWISGFCHVSSSQDEILANAPYVLPNLALGGHNEVVVISDSCTSEEFRHSHSLTSLNEVGSGRGGALEEDVEKTGDLVVFGGSESCRLNTVSTLFQDEDEPVVVVQGSPANTAQMAFDPVEGIFLLGQVEQAKSEAATSQAGSKLRKLPTSFNITDTTGKGGYRPGTRRGKTISSGTADKPPETTVPKKEPSEEELTKNILKVLDLLAKTESPVYKSKVDIIGIAIKAGITFPQPSFWLDDSDDDDADHNVDTSS